MRHGVMFLALLTSTGSCGGDSPPSSTQQAGTGGGPSVDQPRGSAIRTCDSRQVIIQDKAGHHFASDRQSYYWFGSGMTGITIFAVPKAGGDPRVVTSFLDYTGYVLGETTLPVSKDFYYGGRDLVADDRDDYVYFGGDAQIWRVKKDGSEPVQAVSGPVVGENNLDEVPRSIPACNWARSQLTASALVSCRSGRIFRMNRAGEGQAKVIYEAPAGSDIRGFTADDSNVYTHGPYSEERHLAPLLRISVASGENTEVGQMLEGVEPDAIFLVGKNLVFSSLSVRMGPDVDTTSLWAERQGTYRLGLSESVPTMLTRIDLDEVSGADADATDVYTADGDHTIVRISPDGTIKTFVDCTDFAGPGGEMLIGELWVDDEAVYVRAIESDIVYYRFAK
jgi:hypothetical protein